MTDSQVWSPATPREARVINNPGTWHNPTGHLLRNVHPDVWVIERGYVDKGVDVGGKGTIIRLSGGRLFAYSVLPLTPELKAAIDELGTVAIVVAGNSQHVDYVINWKKHYPDATYLAPPGLKEERLDVPFDDEIDADGAPHESYQNDVDVLKQIFIDSAPIMKETVFFHVPSRTLLVTDLVFSFPQQGLPFFTRVAKFLLNNVFANAHLWFLVKDKAAFRESIDAIIQFEFETLVPCHGDIVMNDAVGYLRRWLRHSRE